ncbi:hypothetical protein CKAH01_08355 [Colletotrichum kahawae]|uniref:Tat pathway signal sequence n=1 Tax=Colletotrichum kahawae TaxID=34407 RepID=A0AAE0D0K8_COLKA|nr:hypothetical protein CKAH01_08355 [Colletotrichum kahawae]
MADHNERLSTEDRGIVDDDETSSSINDDSVDLEKALLPVEQNATRRSKTDIDQNRLPLLLRPITWLTVFNIGIFVASCIVWSTTSSKQTPGDQDLWKATSFYFTNGTLYDTRPPSILRQRIGTEADNEWHRIGDHIEVFHHLHCLDMLRREVSYEHYYEEKEGPKPGGAQHQAHIGHCFDILAQAIKCTGSVDMITFNWVENWDQPFPDFMNHKVCRSFDALLDWVNDNAMSPGVFQKMKTPPPGWPVLPEPGPAR